MSDMPDINEPGLPNAPMDPVLPPEVPPSPSETGIPEPIGIPSSQPDSIDDPMSPDPIGIPGDSPSDVPPTGPSEIPSDVPGVMQF